MKAIKRSLLLISALFFSVLTVSCSKNNGSPIMCTDILILDELRFVVLDKETGEDVFFSNEAIYDTNELILFRRGAEGKLEEAYLRKDDEGEDIYFYTPASSGSDTIFMQIADQPLDTIAYSVIPEPEVDCPQPILDEVRFNNETPEENAHGRIVPLYRDAIRMDIN